MKKLNLMKIHWFYENFAPIIRNSRIGRAGRLRDSRFKKPSRRLKTGRRLRGDCRPRCRSPFKLGRGLSGLEHPNSRFAGCQSPRPSFTR